MILGGSGSDHVRLADQIVAYLADCGVRYVFGNPGSSEVPLLDALAVRDMPEFQLVMHEAVGVSMADGYAQLSQEPGVVFAHVTPGVANVLGGLFLASSHRSPVVVIAGQQDSRLLARRPFLASDLVTTVRQFTKWAWEARSADEVLPCLRRALSVAMQPPRGPVLLSIPKDFYGAAMTPNMLPPPAEPTRSLPDQTSIDRAAQILVSARRPVLLSGNGVGAAGQAAVDRAVELAQLIGARVYSEHNAVNMHFPTAHPQYLEGNAHGIARLQRWFLDADVVVALGCDLFMEDEALDSPVIPSDCAIIQLDEDSTEIGRLYPVAAGVAGDITFSLERLVDCVRSRQGEADRVAADRRCAAVAAAKAEQVQIREEFARLRRNSHPIHMTRVYEELRSLLNDDGVMVDEAVNMASYLHQFYEFRKSGTLLSSKQSWLGWGWGAALGAQLALPRQKVVACLGDGSALFGIQALGTAARHHIPVTTIVLNNGRYIAVENHLRQYGGYAASTGRFVGTALPPIDFVGVAEGFGVSGVRVSHASELRPVLAKALNTPAPTLVEIAIDPDDAGWGRPPIDRSPAH